MSSKAGWIVKEGGRYKNWKKRWMAIEGDVISYYKGEVREKLCGVGASTARKRAPFRPPWTYS
jgi:hypothetical protein